jgi:DHA1 family tetracycline resistance protein-like MFS transporter
MSDASPRRAAVIFIFVTVALDILALGMIIPVLPILIEDFQGGDTAVAARTVGMFGTAWAAMQFFASPILGSLSDRFGRRPIILLSNLGLGLDYIFMALAPNLGWLFVGRVISGFTAASIPTAFAYVADVTSADRRAKSYGLLGAAFGVGFIIGPALGGVLGTFGPRAPFWLAGALSLLNACYGFFVLPESLDAEHRAPFSWTRANPLGSLALLRSERRLAGFATIHFIHHLVHHAFTTVFVLYVSYRYGWASVEVGWTLALVGVGFAVVQAGLVGRMVARFGERRTLLTGLAAGMLGFTIYGLAPTGRWFLTGIPVMAMWGFYGPSAQGLMTRRVGRSQQGALQGALSSVQMATGLVGPALFAEVFASFIGSRRPTVFPGAPYLLSAALLVFSFFLALQVTRPEGLD